MRKFFLFFVFGCLISGCARVAVSDRPVLIVSVLPQKYFAEQIAGNAWSVVVLVPPGASPASYELLPSAVRRLSKARLYLLNGYLPVEKVWEKKLKALDQGPVLADTSEGIDLISGHSHDGQKTGVNPHFWLAPETVRIQCSHILEALVQADPHGKTEYEKNYRKLLKKISEVEEELSRIFSDQTGRSFLVYHPAWSYLARQYGLQQIALELHGKEPGTSGMKEFLSQAVQHKNLFVQTQSDQRLAESIARQAGLKVVSLDPLAEDWPENLVKTARLLQRGLH